MEVMKIGTLNEGKLHRSLKEHYVNSGAREEVNVEGFVVDIVTRKGLLIEIQTTGFSGIRRKLKKLIENHQVLLIYPVAAVRYITKIAMEDDMQTETRRSPKKGNFNSLLNELVSIPNLLNHPNFEIEVVLIEEEEFRMHDPSVSWRRKGWRVVDRRLVNILEKRKFASSDDLFGMLHHRLPDRYTTAQIADSLGESRSLAQKFAYCLREAGVIEVCGKIGNALLYRNRDNKFFG